MATRMNMAPSSASPPKCSGALTKTRVPWQSAVTRCLKPTRWSLAPKGPILRSSLPLSSSSTVIINWSLVSSLGKGRSVAFSNSRSALTPWFMSWMPNSEPLPDSPPGKLLAYGPDGNGPRAPMLPIGCRSRTFSSMPQLAGWPSSSLRAYGQICEDRGSLRWIWHRPMVRWPMRPPTWSTWRKSILDWVRSRSIPSASCTTSVSAFLPRAFSSPVRANSLSSSSRTLTRKPLTLPKTLFSIGMSSNREITTTRSSCPAASPGPSS
mmetsp:Transcript_9964/g.29375  ORF Transcript_9964/g.29375 Transcript_9964/m.29375 type:complete len:266 (-) Transcript_9964:186-983(-)